MKVLKLKDPATFKDLITKRGNNVIVFVPDADGNYVNNLDILNDPAYSDLVEVILDSCEVIEYNPLDFDVLEEKPIIQEKGEFIVKLEEAKESIGLNDLLKDQEIKIQQIAKDNKVSIEEATKMYFISIQETTKLSLEEAVRLYYESKKGIIAKMGDAIMRTVVNPVVEFFTPTT